MGQSLFGGRGFVNNQVVIKNEKALKYTLTCNWHTRLTHKSNTCGPYLAFPVQHPAHGKLHDETRLYVACERVDQACSIKRETQQSTAVCEDICLVSQCAMQCNVPSLVLCRTILHMWCVSSHLDTDWCAARSERCAHVFFSLVYRFRFYLVHL